MSEQVIDQLVKLRGIETSFIDAWGNPASVVPQSKATLLAALGYPVDDEEALLEAYENDVEAYWNQITPVVKVVRVGQSSPLEIRCPIYNASQEYIWSMVTESGDKHQGTVKAVDGELVAVHTIDEQEYHAYDIELGLELEPGYHQLELSIAGEKSPLVSVRYIVAQQEAFKQPAISQGKKIWGPSVQLYCLRSERNWGVGDFTDLKDLITGIGASGGDFVGLNPIHSLYPSNPDSCSPYSPSSRRWLNVIYIDVEAIEDYANSAAKALVESPEFKARLEQLRSTEHVDYKGVTEAKIEALKLVFETFQVNNNGRTKRGKAFKAFMIEGGESLLQQASYDAIQEQFYAEFGNAWGWPVWPDEFKKFQNPAVAKWIKDNKSKVDFYAWLQWMADEQMAIADQQAKDSGMEMGIYRDLAVGVSEGSCEIWGQGDLYCQGATVGAPPDILGPLGQNWGLPPMDPEKLIEQQYQPMVDLFRSNMRSCGALRIDHAMALLRLWWVPKGESADKGAYMYYALEDLLGILILESHRNQCLIIGEDLGTVPDGIFETFQENGIHSYRIFLFEQAEDGGYTAPSHYPVQAMAAITTHDMPTLRGFWHCDDLALGRELGLYPDEEVLQSLYSDRHKSKQKILNSLHGLGSIPEHISNDVNWVGMDQELNYGMQTHMAAGSCALLSLQLEDWLQMDKPVNIPGTFEEYPNWRRKLSHNLSDIFNDSQITDLLAKISLARKNAS
ncbi:4-alpha-glucanotransferase [Alginatibacterium sediminis]|uniref:4-alpha-glucanotransferase n=1 Tax=Alginatibacterium sediminis TaxID=2164068 RepID=A0A420EFX5_9ALTE|nr:4-alpha-glucanotransferase [Alginatibacterium sediminis]RKF19587.1 4-alpha-glucanotransferase [Alginatibacterium sediminis]